MARRIVLEVALILGITVLLAWPVIGSLGFTAPVDPVVVFVDQPFRVLFGLLGVALGLWTLLLIVGSIVLRRRGRGWRIASHLVSLVIALVVNVGVLTALALSSNRGAGDSWGMLVVTIAAAAGGLLLGTGTTAVLLVELVILRPKRVLEPERPLIPQAL